MVSDEKSGGNGSSDAGTVGKRRVFYLPGYDPIHPRRYRELYRAEAARQAHSLPSAVFDHLPHLDSGPVPVEPVAVLEGGCRR